MKADESVSGGYIDICTRNVAVFNQAREEAQSALDAVEGFASLNRKLVEELRCEINLPHPSPDPRVLTPRFVAITFDTTHSRQSITLIAAV